MSSKIRVLPVESASDGTFATPSVPTMTRNDDYFLDKIAERWSKDLLLPQAGITYRLNALPRGYAGFEKKRADKEHIDRYLYGHPSGVFRSLNELYPHFKHLQENGGPIGCTCKLCSPASARRASAVNGNGQPRSVTPSVVHVSPPANMINDDINAMLRAPFFNDQPSLDAPTPPRRQQIDSDGCPDAYRAVLDRVRDAGDGPCRGEFINESSPDWNVSHVDLVKAIDTCRKFPAYSPRIGELVLFTRSVPEADQVAWDKTTQSLRCTTPGSDIWLESPVWEAGVVSQIPLKKPSQIDLKQIPSMQSQNIVNAGYQIEPLSPIGKVGKSFTQYRRYVPLHLVRPFWAWEQCLYRVREDDWHPTIKAAMTIANSFCIIGRHKYAGSWPEATIFASAVYLGAELITVGDVVRLLPRSRDEQLLEVTDILVITSIRLKFVNLDEANDDDYDETHPYNTCLHASGRAYTLKPERSYDGVGKTPIHSDSDTLPSGVQEYGVWYPVLDPARPNLRLEIPYHRILSRLTDHSAVKVWFAEPDTPHNHDPQAVPKAPTPPPPNFLAVNSQTSTLTKIATVDPASTFATLDQGLTAIRQAREYSIANDSRINRAAGKTWFWAETRIEQLDLHEINGRTVGVKDLERTRMKVYDWRKACKILEEKKDVETRSIEQKPPAHDGNAMEVDGQGKTSGGIIHGDEEEESSDDDEHDSIPAGRPILSVDSSSDESMGGV